MPNMLDLKIVEIQSSPIYPETIQVEVAHLELSCNASIVIIMTASYVPVQA